MVVKSASFRNRGAEDPRGCRERLQRGEIDPCVRVATPLCNQRATLRGSGHPESIGAAMAKPVERRAAINVNMPITTYPRVYFLRYGCLIGFTRAVAGRDQRRACARTRA